VRGLPGEARLHDALHERYMLQRKPKAEPRLVTFAGDVRVDANSPKWLQRIAYRFAVGLRRSDFRQWGAGLSGILCSGP
jgi:hypothetical protein